MVVALARISRVSGSDRDFDRARSAILLLRIYDAANFIKFRSWAAQSKCAGFAIYYCFVERLNWFHPARVAGAIDQLYVILSVADR